MAQQFCDAVECESFANGAEIELQLAAQTKNGLFIRQQTPLRKRELTFQSCGSCAKCAVCGPLHPFRDLQAGKDWLAQAHLFARRKISDAGDIAVASKAAQARFQRIDQVKCSLCSLSRVRFLIAVDAHLKMRSHSGVVELMDITHRNSFWCGRPQQDQHTGTNSEELRMKILQSVGVLVRSLR